MQDSTDRRDAKVFRAHAAPQGVCDILVKAPKLLVNQQKDVESPDKMVVQGLQETSRLKFMDGPHGTQPRGGDQGKNVESR